jgi:hypothetical protein
MADESDYRWSHRSSSSYNLVRGETANLKDAVDAVERHVTTLNGHQRLALAEAREAAGLPC